MSKAIITECINQLGAMRTTTNAQESIRLSVIGKLNQIVNKAAPATNQRFSPKPAKQKSSTALPMTDSPSPKPRNSPSPSPNPQA